VSEFHSRLVQLGGKGLIICSSLWSVVVIVDFRWSFETSEGVECVLNYKNMNFSDLDELGAE
jgi:hypothetical protein